MKRGVKLALGECNPPVPASSEACRVEKSYPARGQQGAEPGVRRRRPRKVRRAWKCSTDNHAGAKDVSPDAVRDALQALYDAVGQTNLPQGIQIDAQLAAGGALKEGIKDGGVDPDKLVSNVKKVGEALEQANVAVKEGTALWESVQKVATAVAPLVVGGAPLVLRWFGIGG